MVQLTVGHVSGMLSAAIFFVSFTFAIALVVILVGLLETTNSAITWSVFSRLIHNSPWSMFMASDTSAVTHVRRHVWILSKLSLVGTLLITVAGVVTPLGLTQEVVPSGISTVQFAYHYDNTSSFGGATTPRNGFSFNRQCGDLVIAACPGQNTTWSGIVDNSTGLFEIVNNAETANITIPDSLMKVFSSGTSQLGNTVSGAFDIQPRNWLYATDPVVMNGSIYPQPVQESSSYILLDNKIEAVEGLIVDTRVGMAALGFRNHTLPLANGAGAIWQEDLLYLQPQTSCVNLNISINYTMQDLPEYINSSTVFFTDLGGLANLNLTYPEYNYTGGQTDPELFQRAYKGAWVHNICLAAFFNATSALKAGSLKVGDVYIPSPAANQYSLSGLSFGVGGYLLFTIDLFSDVLLLPSGDSNTTFTRGNDTYDLSIIDVLCQGFGGGDVLDIDTILVSCGMVLSTPTRTDGGDPLILTPYANFSNELYICATTVRADIETTKFNYNGTGGLPGLQLERTPRNSSALGVPPPVWAVEEIPLNISQANPLWGLVDISYRDSPGLQTLQQDHLYLPAAESAFWSVASDTDASASVPGAILTSLWGTGGGGGLVDNTLDYSGSQNAAILRKWQQLGGSPEGVASMVDLIFTDIATQWMVGTKTLLDAYQTPPNVTTVPLNVQLLESQIKYNLLFAIPAIVILSIWLIIMLGAAAVGLSRRVTPRRIQLLLNQTAAGRMVMNLISANPMPFTTPTRQWILSEGYTPLTLVRGRLEGEESDTLQFVQSSSGRGEPIERVLSSPAMRSPTQEKLSPETSDEREINSAPENSDTPESTTSVHEIQES